MNLKLTAGAVCALFTLLCGVSRAQEAIAAQSPAAAAVAATAPAPAAPPAPEAKPDTDNSATTDTTGAPATASKPQKPFFKRMWTVQAITSTLPGAVLQQVHDWPSEWGKDRLGFEKRVASLYGQFVIGLVIEDAVRTIHPEDTRFHRLGKGGLFPRFAHVVTDTVTARRPDDGGRTMAFSLPANAYGSWAIATLWSPREYRNVDSILVWGTAGMGTMAIGNLFREFGPDMLSVFHKKKQ
ncbi:MAG: hypothetical protein ACLQU1_38685 [Bryobacteraceae bacterium]